MVEDKDRVALLALHPGWARPAVALQKSNTHTHTHTRTHTHTPRERERGRGRERERERRERPLSEHRTVQRHLDESSRLAHIIRGGDTLSDAGLLPHLQLKQHRMPMQN